MSFNKFGMLKTSKIEIIENLSNWETLCKQASTIAEPVKEAVDKEADFQVVGTVDPEKFIYIHTTIMAGVKTAENGFWITPETEKFINDNHDAWKCEDLLKDYKTFKRATTFVEHDQRLEMARGRCVDVIARDMGDTLLIDVLFSVDKRHKDLVANIENGIINAVSMGCSTAQTRCSICGNIASDPSTYCEHLKRGNKGSKFRLPDGSTRRAAEICLSNTFFDVSLVANPAFAGAVFRKILSSSEISNHLLANILNSKIEALYKEDSLILKAASKDLDVANISIKQDGSIEINTASQIFKTDGVLSKEEIEGICTCVPKKSNTVMEKVLEKIFGKKEATHPILNQTGEKDFSISNKDYSDIPFRDRHNILDESGLDEYSLDLNPKQQIIVLEIQPASNNSNQITSRVDKFECVRCGFITDLWKVKASSVDAGQLNFIECPRCFYSSEESLHKIAKTKIKNKDEIVIKKGEDKGLKGKVVSLKGPLLVIKLENGKTVWKSPSDVEIKKATFIASQDIPVDNDEGIYWFDENGNSVITKGEKVSFVTTVDNDEYGQFVTETGEDFFMPMSCIKKK